MIMFVMIMVIMFIMIMLIIFFTIMMERLNLVFHWLASWTLLVDG